MKAKAIWYYVFEGVCGDRRVNLYSRATEEGKEFPFLSMRECQAQARRNGAKASFHRSPGNAKAAMMLDTAGFPVNDNINEGCR